MFSHPTYSNPFAPANAFVLTVVFLIESMELAVLSHLDRKIPAPTHDTESITITSCHKNDAVFDGNWYAGYIASLTNIGTISTATDRLTM